MREERLHNERHPPPFLFTHPWATETNGGRKEIFENVHKRLSVSLTHLPKGVIRALTSVRVP